MTDAVSESDIAAVAARLRAAGAAISADALGRLLRGIAAAPVRDRAWLGLLGGTIDAALARDLDALRARLAAAPDGIGAPGATGDRVAALRAVLATRDLDGFVIPLSDEHQGEYVARRAQRLAWLTGFTGSAGVAIVLADKAAIFVDGRYTLQAEAEVDPALFTRHHLIEDPPDRWLRAALKEGQALGYDPWLHTDDGRARLDAACQAVGATLVPGSDNPVDAVWDDQPARPLGPIAAHPIEFAGTQSAEKRDAVAVVVREAGAGAAVLSAPDAIAWLLNVRGGDVTCSPLPQSFAVIHEDTRVEWFVDARKLLPEVAAHLGNAVEVRPPDALDAALDALGAATRVVMVDRAGTPVCLVDRLSEAGARVLRRGDPCARLKACKNAAELDGARAAHRRDGAALSRFLGWLEEAAAPGTLTEMMAAERLAAFREGGAHYCGPSFETISGAGPNGAIVHYRVSEATDRALEPGSLYLVDSGGQYLDGTTDVTRTVAIGTPSAEHRDRFTRVLKGHIALARARFPKGTTGAQLDALARQFLWQAGLDYDHGTGHGVGSYLNVHEGPQRISKFPSTAGLEPGMIVSNEPGYYKTGAYGIRIENLVAVVEIDAGPAAEREMLGFETLTLAPIDRHLIDATALDTAERAWLDDYHARVRAAIGPQLAGDAAATAWLDAATAPLGDASPPTEPDQPAG